MRGSGFASEVLKDCPAQWLAFKWSGTNSFVARSEAVEAFHEHLKKSLQTPDTRHIIVAHSHGGTVAVAAAMRLEKAERARIDGIVTMGTPFITFRDTNSSALRTAKYLVGRLGLSVFLLYVLCVLLAWWFQLSPYLLNGLALTILPWCALLSIATRSPFDRYFFSFKYAKPNNIVDLFDGDIQFHGPLVALRAPGDEAGLAIGAAQLLNYIGEKVWSLTALAGLGMLRRYGNWTMATRSRSILTILCVIVLSGFVMWGRQGSLPIDELDHEPFVNRWVAMAINIGFGVTLEFGILAIFAVLIVLFVILLTTLAILPGIVVLRFAAGREVWDLAGFADVECEPIPSGMKAVVETFHFAAADRAKLVQRGVLRHSFHEMSAARRRVAELIEEWTSPHGDSVQNIKEGGRVCDLLFEVWEERYRSRLAAGGDEALATFRRLFDIVLESKNEVSESIFRQRFVQLLPQKEQKSMSIECEYAVIKQSLELVGQRLDELE